MAFIAIRTRRGGVILRPSRHLLTLAPSILCDNNTGRYIFEMKPVVAVLSLCAAPATGFSFVPSQCVRSSAPAATATVTRRPRSSLSMVDTNVLLGGGIAVGGVVAGIGLVAFAENSESSVQRCALENRATVKSLA